jgi:hypothetical protein
MNNWQPIPRRTFLRGLGTAVALPLLDGMHLETAPASTTADELTGVTAGENPIRMVFMYVPNGVHMPGWTPRQEGAGFDLPPILAPLSNLRDDVLVVSGLANHKADPNGDGAGDHARGAATFLTGAQAVKTDGKDIRVGISVDQIAAQHLGRQTRLPSLEIGCELGPSAGSCDSGYSCAYSNNISWRSPSTPATKEVNPRLVFDRLFGGDSKEQLERSRWKRDHDRKSVLDFVADDAGRLRRRLGQSDRRKLDEYIQSIRAVERLIDHPPDELIVDGAPQRPRGIPVDFAKHARIMADLLTLAFQTDATRVSTFMIANGGSDRVYPAIEIREGHHTLSHHQDKSELQSKISRINQYHVTQLAYLLERLKSTREGDRTLLDRTIVVYGSGISDGNRHNHDDLPILIAGRGGGAIEPGRHLRLAAGTPLMNLYLAMLQAVGVPVSRIGDSTGPLVAVRTS